MTFLDLKSDVMPLERKNSVQRKSCPTPGVRQPGACGFCDRASESVLNLPDGPVKIFRRSKITEAL